MGNGWLPLLVYITQQTGKRPPGNGRVNYPRVRLRPANYCRMVDFLHGGILQQCMHMGIFRQKNNAKGIPIQAGHRMKRAVLSGFSKISRNEIC